MITRPIFQRKDPPPDHKVTLPPLRTTGVPRFSPPPPHIPAEPVIPGRR